MWKCCSPPQGQSKRSVKIFHKIKVLSSLRMARSVKCTANSTLAWRGQMHCKLHPRMARSVKCKLYPRMVRSVKCTANFTLAVNCLGAEYAFIKCCTIVLRLLSADSKNISPNLWILEKNYVAIIESHQQVFTSHLCVNIRIPGNIFVDLKLRTLLKYRW